MEIPAASSFRLLRTSLTRLGQRGKRNLSGFRNAFSGENQTIFSCPEKSTLSCFISQR